jgi:hypothetical protein
LISLIRDICLDAWFNRVWLLQEMKLAYVVLLVGRRATIQLESFLDAIKGIRTLSSHVYLDIGHNTRLGGTALPLEIRGILSLMQEPDVLTLGNALRLASDRACTRPEDRLFAVRNLLSEPSLIRVRYEARHLYEQINLYLAGTRDASFMLFN